MEEQDTSLVSALSLLTTKAYQPSEIMRATSALFLDLVKETLRNPSSDEHLKLITIDEKRSRGYRGKRTSNLKKLRM